MKAIVAVLFLWLVGIVCTAQACEVVDDEGRIVKLSQPAKRIISLAPDLTELLFAAGAGDRIVGVMRGSDYPLQAKKIPIVADFNHIDAEKILLLHPDLIIVWAEGSIPEQLKMLNIPVYLSRQKKLLDIPKTLRRFGCLAGTERVANKVAENFIRHYSVLQKKYSQQKKITVFYELWSVPLMTVTKESWINEVITLCGGENIFAQLRGTSPEVSIEAVLSKNPEVMISASQQKDWQVRWQKWMQISAVKNNNLFSLTPDLIERASPRILLGVEEVCRDVERVRLLTHPKLSEANCHSNSTCHPERSEGSSS